MTQSKLRKEPYQVGRAVSPYPAPDQKGHEQVGTCVLGVCVCVPRPAYKWTSSPGTPRTASSDASERGFPVARRLLQQSREGVRAAAVLLRHHTDCPRLCALAARGVPRPALCTGVYPIRCSEERTPFGFPLCSGEIFTLPSPMGTPASLQLGAGACLP